MGELGQLAIQDQLAAQGQQLGAPQLQPQPANGVPEPEHHDENAKGDAGHGLDRILELLEGALELEVGHQTGLAGELALIGDQQALVFLILDVAKPVDALLALMDLQLDHAGRAQQGRQPAGEIPVVIGHLQLLVEHLHQGADLVLLQLETELAKTEYPPQQHHGHGRYHAQGDEGDELCGEFHGPSVCTNVRVDSW